MSRRNGLFHLRPVVGVLRESGLLSVDGRVGDGVCRLDSNLGWVVALATPTDRFEPVRPFVCPKTISELVVLAQKLKEVVKSVLLHILNHLSEQEPVTVLNKIMIIIIHIKPSNIISTHRSVPTDIGNQIPVIVRLPEHEHPDPGEEDADHPVEDGHGAEDRQEDVPVPQHQVDLLVDNVERQYAHGIVVLCGSATYKIILHERSTLT